MSKPLELARLLLCKAEEDGRVVFDVPDSIGLSDAIFGFHAQQMAEKLLKAVLTVREIRFRRTHQLQTLLGLLEDEGLAIPPWLREIDPLSPFSVEYRYLDPPVGEEPPVDRESLRELLRRLDLWARGQIETG